MSGPTKGIPVLLDIASPPDWIVAMHLYAKTFWEDLHHTPRDMTDIVKLEVEEMEPIDRLPWTEEVKKELRMSERVYLVYRVQKGSGEKWHPVL